jgi:hypothetical protein
MEKEKKIQLAFAVTAVVSGVSVYYLLKNKNDSNKKKE